MKHKLKKKNYQHLFETINMSLKEVHVLPTWLRAKRLFHFKIPKTQPSPHLPPQLLLLIPKLQRKQIVEWKLQENGNDVTFSKLSFSSSSFLFDLSLSSHFPLKIPHYKSMGQCFWVFSKSLIFSPKFPPVF